MAKGADRPGMKTDPEVVDFVRKISEVERQPVTIGTGTNHSRLVSGTADHESAHWTGRAADIPATGNRLIALGQSALIAAGMPEAEARKQKGGLFNINGYQIIFNTVLKHGGDHTNHLHVGLRGAK